MRFLKVTIIKTKAPDSDINKELQWLGYSLGLFSERDKDKSCYRIFVELLKDLKIKSGYTSDELAYRLGLTRGTIVHHLNKLIDSGIVTHQKGRYYLAVDSVEMLIDTMKKNVMSFFDDLKIVGRSIDKRFGIEKNDNL